MKKNTLIPVALLVLTFAALGQSDTQDRVKPIKVAPAKPADAPAIPAPPATPAPMPPRSSYGLSLNRAYASVTSLNAGNLNAVVMAL